MTGPGFASCHGSAALIARPGAAGASAEPLMRAARIRAMWKVGTRDASARLPTFLSRISC
jgi:hypothetical protein